MKPRGRFDIVCVFDDGAYVRFTSHETRSLPPLELWAALRKYADAIANGLIAQGEAEPRQTETGAPACPRHPLLANTEEHPCVVCQMEQITADLEAARVSRK